MPTSSKWKNLPTEAINPVSLDLDKATTEEIIDLMLKEDRKVVSSVYRERNRIAMAADLLMDYVYLRPASSSRSRFRQCQGSLH